MSRRKRKQSVPEKSSEEKRLKMTWNMSDLRSTSSFVVVSDEAIERFREGSRTFSNELTSRKGNFKRRQKQCISKISNEDLPCVRLRIRSFFPQDWTCVLGSFEVLPVPAEMPDFRSLLNTAELVDLQFEDFNSVTVLVRFDDSKPSSSGDCKTARILQNAQEARAVVLKVSDQQLQAIEYLESKGILSLVQKENRDNCLEVLVCLRKAAVAPLTFASEDTVMRKSDKMVKTLMSWLFPSISTSDECESNEFEPTSENHGSGFDDLYDAVKTIRESSLGIVKSRNEVAGSIKRADSIYEHRPDVTKMQERQNCEDINSINVDQGLDCDELRHPLHNNSCSYNQSDVLAQGGWKTSCQPDQVRANIQTMAECDELLEIQHPDLIPELRGYQKRAVHWMLGKELGSGHHREQDKNLHILWREVKVLSGKNIYFNPHTGRFSMEKYSMPSLPSGGILADEMGLGKTVEVLTCILNNPRHVTEHQACGSIESRGDSKADVGKVNKNSNFCNSETLPGKVTNGDCDWQGKGFTPSSISEATKSSLTTQNAGSDTCHCELYSINSDNGRTTEVCRQNSTDLLRPCSALPQQTNSSATKSLQTQSVNCDTCDSVGSGSSSDGCRTREVHQGNPQHLSEESCSVLTHSLEVGSNTSKPSPIGHVVGDTCDSVKNSPRSDIRRTGENLCRENPTDLMSSCCTLTNSLEVKGSAMKYLATQPVHGETSHSTCSDTITYVESCNENSTVLMENDSSLLHEWSLALKSSMVNLKNKSNNLHLPSMEKVHQNGARNLFNDVSAPEIAQQAEPSIDFQETMSKTSTLEMPERKLLNSSDETVAEKKHCTVLTAGEVTCTKPANEIDTTPFCCVSAKKNVSLTSDECEILSRSDEICRPVTAYGVKDVTRDVYNSFQSTFGEIHSGLKISTKEESSYNTQDKSSSQIAFTSPDSSFCSPLIASFNSCQVQQNVDDTKSRILSAASKEESDGTTHNCAFSNKSFAVSNDSNQYCDNTSDNASDDTSEDCKIGLQVEVSCICGYSEPCSSKDVLQCVECGVIVHMECSHCYTARQFVCPQCTVNGSPVQSRATLIISPASIAQQWEEEIMRHTRPSALKLLVYEGVSRQGFIPPEILADHDVILTTYATLRADFYHLRVKQVNRSRRYHQRYATLPSPLTAVHFWRICLDEAQMVESTTAKAAEMALHLQCVHRWCVTGTPIQKGLDDIYGLFLFLGVYPYCQKVWWKKLLYQPYMINHRQPMYEVLAKLMWRSAKKDVLHEIQLPGQTEQVKWLTFTPVEQHFYHRQHEDCSATASKLLSGWQESDTRLSSIDRHTVHRMLYPLLRLRQACCHPQAVRGGFLSLQKSMLTMDKLLDSLIARAKLECEEAHRQLLFSLNGMAGIHIIKTEWPEAVECYRDSMRSWKEHEDKFKTDSLQKLHTVHNLADILSKDHQGCSHSLMDDKLREQSSELRKHYMLKPNAQVETAQQNLVVEQHSIEEIESQVNFKDPWWINVIQQVSRPGPRGLQEELMIRIRNDLAGTDFLDRFTDLVGLQYVIATKLDMMESTRATLEEALKKVSIEPTAEMVITTAECCLRPVGDSHAKRCEFCQVDDVFTEYESRLFGHQGMQRVEAESLTDGEPLDWHRHGNTGGLRADTDTEKALKAIFSFSKSQRLIKSGDKQEARSHLNFIEARKKEFKFLRAVWFSLRERVSALDELDMCTTRLRLLLPGEQLAEDRHVIHPLQVEQQRMKFISDRISAQIELRKKLGQLLYLSNLAKTQNVASGENPDLCPVCTKRLGVQWSVFSCGHCYCCQCVWVLLRQAGAGPRGHGNVHVRCPMCRVPTLAQEISYVSTAGQQTDKNEEDIVVKGSHSTKVEAVVRTLVHINRTDPAAKSLVFSTWQDVLDVIARALEENDVLFTQICGNRNFQASLQSFKHDPAVCVLLLPLHSGSNGLNIIEATHVLLVEPSLNPAHELQAVGRVHRIGQTRPTHVHRFIIRGTVESRMYSLLRSKSSAVIRTGSRDTENSSLTVGDLAQLFTDDESAEQMGDPLPGPLAQPEDHEEERQG